MIKKYQGKNKEDALNIAVKDKNVSVEELTYEVIEETSGFLGFGSKVIIEAYCKEDIKEYMKEYLLNYFNGIQMSAEVNVSEDGGYYHVDVSADNNAVLIGKNGQTLQAINTVLKSATSAKFKTRIHVLIDINGYKEVKYEKVCALALRVAKSVRRTKTDAILDPMPADERKAIHNYLSSMKGVSTVSEGEGNQRRLKIVYTPDKQ